MSEGERYTIRLRVENLPFRSLNDAAVRCRMAGSSVWRVARGQRAPSAVMIATMLAVSGMRFDDLFEIVPETTERAA